MKFYGCDGEGHRQKLCPGVPGNTMVCNNCHGKGHYAALCTSKGGGAFKGGKEEKGTGNRGASKGGGNSKGKNWPKGMCWSNGGKGKGAQGLPQEYLSSLNTGYGSENWDTLVWY